MEEEFASQFLREHTIHETDGDDDAQQDHPVPTTPNATTTTTTDSAKKARTIRNGIFRAAGLQDKLLEKLISQVIPSEPSSSSSSSIPTIVTDDMQSLPPTFPDRPGFSIPLMSNNFRRFNARIGVVFKFQARALRVLSWRKPTHTLSLLAVYTFVCLDPYLLFAIPLVIALVGVLVPSFIARHPAPPTAELNYSPRGPPLAPAKTFKPTKELSRDFFKNMGDLQNVMEDFSVAHDKVITLIVPKTNFSDEALSSAIFVFLFAGTAVMLISAHLIPWRYLMLVGGWAGILSLHPVVARYIQQYIDTKEQVTTAEKKGEAVALPQQFDAFAVLQEFVKEDIILDSAPETREVEIFELQHLSHTSGEWEPWFFSPSPYDPLSAPRIAGERPKGTRFFEDVLAPEGWEWSEKKWALDLWSREWVEERIITGVEVETEGERWVYDMCSPGQGGGCGEDGGDSNDGGDGVVRTQVSAQIQKTSWEESDAGDDGVGRRGEWRRRRWVRLVKRKNVTGSG
ncbi:integral peroxisomal membrane peroxin-domain-containing protein [Podospora fimiseda]|uniref:Integral peroxisomal membrane peroxin-domain-containing protein n=1 Tax=Podospora fimiseda TaxID=252190 RepID=A0AAN7GZR2_9PEZI|nr:integral peroxisomal membrane peroxin-domain-containing protein [Podospora fimiseda]